MFKTAEELGIEQWEREGLIKLLDKLPLLRHVSDNYNPTEEGAAFNMNYGASNDTFECGSVFCIGGWCKVDQLGLDPMNLAQDQVDEINDYVNGPKDALEELYFPGDNSNADYNFDSITNEQAVQAVRNFLTTGEASWEDILTDDQLYH